jgi:uncharacterized protein
MEHCPRVFGSAISGNDTDESDLDLLVDLTPLTTLHTLAALQLEAERLLGVRVDVLTPKSLPKAFRERTARNSRQDSSHVSGSIQVSAIGHEKQARRCSTLPTSQPLAPPVDALGCFGGAYQSTQQSHRDPYRRSRNRSSNSMLS